MARASIAWVLLVALAGVAFYAWQKNRQDARPAYGCTASGCDPSLRQMARGDDPGARIEAIATLERIGDDPAQPAAVRAQAWLELAHLLEADPTLADEPDSGSTARDFYALAAIRGSREAHEWYEAHPAPDGRPDHLVGDDHGNWSAALTWDAGARTCFISSGHNDVAAGDSDRRQNLVFFTRAPGWNPVQLQYNAGIDVAADPPPFIRLPEGSPVIGRPSDSSARILLFGDEDDTLLRRLAEHRAAEITMSTTAGETLVDRIPLDGLLSAYDDMPTVCGFDRS